MKSFKKIMVSVIAVAVCLSCVLGLAGCNKGPEITDKTYADQVKAWNDATGEKTITDDISIKLPISITLSGNVQNVELGIKGQITRKFNGKEIVELNGKVTALNVTMATAIVNMVKTFVTLPQDVLDLIEVEGNNSTIKFEGNIAEGYIKVKDVNGEKCFAMAGKANIGTVTGIKISTTAPFDANGDIGDLSKDLLTFPVDSVKQYLEDFGAEIDFNRISLLDYTKGTFVVGEDKTVTCTYDTNKAMAYLLDQLFATVDSFMAGELDDTIEGVITTDNASDIVKKIALIRTGSDKTWLNKGDAFVAGTFYQQYNGRTKVGEPFDGATKTAACEADFKYTILDENKAEQSWKGIEGYVTEFFGASYADDLSGLIKSILVLNTESTAKLTFTEDGKIGTIAGNEALTIKITKSTWEKAAKLIAGILPPSLSGVSSIVKGLFPNGINITATVEYTSTYAY